MINFCNNDRFVAQIEFSGNIGTINNRPVFLMENIDFKIEFDQLLTLICSSWSVNTEHFNAAAKDAFNQGLYDGRFWVDKYVNYRVGRALNQSTSKLCPIFDRENKVDSTYDALCVFSSNIYASLSKIEESQLRFGRWSYCEKMNQVMEDLRCKYILKGLRPVEMTKAAQQELINNYPGFDAAGARTLSTPVKLSYSDATYSKQEQGMSFARTLFSAIYSHGLACAQEFNDRSLVAVLTRIYSEFRDSPFSVNNGESFMDIARQAEFFMLIEAVSPFSFISEEQYDSEMAALTVYRKKLEAMSKDERSVYEESERVERENFLDEIINELKCEEDGASEKLAERDALIESYRERLSKFFI